MNQNPLTSEQLNNAYFKFIKLRNKTNGCGFW